MLGYWNFIVEIVIVYRRCSDLSVDVTVVFVIGCVSMDLVQERGRGMSDTFWVRLLSRRAHTTRTGHRVSVLAKGHADN